MYFLYPFQHMYYNVYQVLYLTQQFPDQELFKWNDILQNEDSDLHPQFVISSDI